jgi:hypothetical protein
MDAGSSLDAGLFVGGEPKFIIAQRLILPDSLIKIQKATGFGGRGPDRAEKSSSGVASAEWRLGEASARQSYR